MTEPHVGKTMLVLDIVYAFADSCVALFLMMTGYLMTNKKLSRSYYKGVLHLIVMYILCCDICLTYKVIVYDYELSVKEWAGRILNFTACDYGWYFEMYLGLFLLIPFLNAAYHGLDSKKKKLALVATMIVLTALPGVLNTFNFKLPGWWQQPSLSREYNKLVPEYWTASYPITFYFLGCYLREFPPKLKKRLIALIWLVAGVGSGAYFFYRFHYGTFLWDGYAINSSLLNVFVAASLFSLVVSLDLTPIPGWMKKTLSYLAKCTFAAYLLSAMFDIIVYKHFKTLVPDLSAQYRAAPIVVVIIFTLSLSLSAMLNGVCDLVVLAAGKIKKRRSRAR